MAVVVFRLRAQVNAPRTVVRAVLAFLALPGVVAFLVPTLLIAGQPVSFHIAGLVPLGLGSWLLLRCVSIFYRQGGGTLAPWDPPRTLVTSGPYRWSRNPMYVAVALVLCGWTVAFRSRSLLIYTAAVILAFHLRIVFGEEPWLARTHGKQWLLYRTHVPRWLGFPGPRSTPE